MCSNWKCHLRATEPFLSLLCHCCATTIQSSKKTFNKGFKLSANKPCSAPNLSSRCKIGCFGIRTFGNMCGSVCNVPWPMFSGFKPKHIPSLTGLRISGEHNSLHQFGTFRIFKSNLLLVMSTLNESHPNSQMISSPACRSSHLIGISQSKKICEISCFLALLLSSSQPLLFACVSFLDHLQWQILIRSSAI